MNKYAFAGAAVLLVGTLQSPALAQSKQATPLASLTQEQKDHGVETFQLLASAMQSPNVPEKIKSVLMGCMYENSVGQISEAVDGVIKDNPGKIDRTKPEQVVGVIARICGYTPDETAPSAAPGKKTGTPPPAAPKSGAPKGR
jgi:hypothetical protein